LALGMANNAVMQFVDRVFLSNESTASLEAVLPASMLALLFVGFFQSVIVYSGTFVAQYFGAGMEEGCRRSYKAALVLSAIFGVVLLGLVPVGNFVFDLVGHSAEVVEREKAYYSIVVLGGFATCGMMAANGYFTGKGRTRLVFWVNLLGNVLNILFDYLFIFGFDLGISGLRMAPCGIAGAAWATVIAQVAQMLVLNVIAYLLMFTLAVVFGAMVVRMVTVGIMAGPDEIMDGVFGSLATMLGLCVPLFGVFIAMKVIRFMALFDLYASCDPENRVIFLVLSILIGISEPILLFICRNKDGGMPPRRPVPEYTQPVYEAPAEESDDQETEM
jgi:MATE family multidrug resistance protein